MPEAATLLPAPVNGLGAGVAGLTGATEGALAVGAGTMAVVTSDDGTGKGGIGDGRDTGGTSTEVSTVGAGGAGVTWVSTVVGAGEGWVSTLDGMTTALVE